MAAKSVFDIKCFKDVKLGFTLRYIEIRNHFLKYPPPPPPPPPPSLYKQTNLTKDHLHLLWVNANGFQLK